MSVVSSSTSLSTTTESLRAAVAAMNDGMHFFDVTIICTTDDHQASYWMDLLEHGLLSATTRSTTSAGTSDSTLIINDDDDGVSGHPDPKTKKKLVLAVSEDWNDPGGAGNGLGTLYAWQKACALATTKYDGFDLMQALVDGTVSAALYHTAGKGTRMAPLPASENNNKPGVRLPFPLKLPDGTIRPLTVLEAVLRQTGIYAHHRKGRLSVFWGDQVFLPSTSLSSSTVPTHHADIMCTLIGDQAPTAQEWHEQGLDKYGVIAVIGNDDNNNDGTGHSSRQVEEAAQVEKVSHETATAMLSSLGKLKQVGPSLGSFSISAPLLGALMDEFASELVSKTNKLDTDPHFWMPLTLPETSYVSLMKQKGTDEIVSQSHHHRMNAMKDAFIKATAQSHPNMGLFGAVDVGKNACWWDYGQLKLYAANSLALLEGTESSQLLREFLGVDGHVMDSTIGDGVIVDDASYIFGSKILNSSSRIGRSIVAGVSVGTLHADNGAIIVNCAAHKIVAGPGSILYNLVDNTPDGITVGAGEVVVAVNSAPDSGNTSNEGDNSKVMWLRSHMEIDGGVAWKTKLDMNECSFEQVHANNKNANIGVIAQLRQRNYDHVVRSLTSN